MTNFLLSLLILLALAASWYLGYRSHAQRPLQPKRKLDQDYFIGLNYLLNDEPDDAVDIFIDALEVNSTTLESYMALGTLLRRRGKVDRSISVYQSLLTRPQLSEDELNQVKLGLVRSYVAAGLLDRAELLIDELKSANMEVRQAALNLGISVYQLEKEWHKAIAAVEEIIKICPVHQRYTYQHLASHFFCELAQEEIDRQHFNQAREYLKDAAEMDRNNVRASLLGGTLEYRQGNYRKAVRMLRRIEQQDNAFTPESFPLLVTAYREAGMDKELERFIQSNMQGTVAPPMLPGILDYLERDGQKDRAREFALRQIRLNPSLETAAGVASVLREDDDGNALIREIFENVVDGTLENKPQYQCNNCGFKLKQLHWLCPGCNQWGGIKPLWIGGEE